jgi:dolichyl-phosphate beta-glucosyltransferase
VSTSRETALVGYPAAAGEEPVCDLDGAEPRPDPGAEAPDLSVVIPAFNEAARLGPTLGEVTSYLEHRGLPFEVLVVDDGSTDGTAEVAASFADRRVRLVRLPANRGKGAALREGVHASRGRRVLLTDADLSTPIADLERLEPHLGPAAVVLGSRALPSSRITRRQPRYRELMGKTFNAVLRLLGLVEFRDTQCGFKLLEGGAARSLFAELTVERFAYDVELVLLARRRGLRLAEVGVSWEDSPSSRVDPLKDSARMLWDVLRLRLRRRP